MLLRTQGLAKRFERRGVCVDAVISDFISGAIEQLCPAAPEDHWDLIEGQGSLFHPGYAGVSLGLLHGSQPDAFVVCHDAARTRLSDFEHYAVPSLTECIGQHVLLGRRTNPAIRCAGISLNTSRLPPERRAAVRAGVAAETGLPCVDPLLDGCDAIVDHICRTLEE